MPNNRLVADAGSNAAPCAGHLYAGAAQPGWTILRITAILGKEKMNG
ncbi:MAG: hypothetical protein KKF30_13940 [Proteobacteria bacterium]|nr:hypothetical protein [Pseudomonadota bacterium]MBU4472418.1 hypothetical protein [Pseudomonadota bacterium]